MATFTPLFINGSNTPANPPETFDVNHSVKGLTGTAASASSDDCLAAIKAASEAFKTWEKSPFKERRVIFMRAASLFKTEKYRQKVFDAMMSETAASLAWCELNLQLCNSYLEHASGKLDQLSGHTFPSGVPGSTVTTSRRALGVVFAAAPWNAPTLLAINSVATAILCGNTVVLKGSELSPRCQAIVAEAFQEAGLPAGVLNYLIFSKENAPKLTAEVIAHPAVRKICFTGSDKIGRLIAVEAAKHLKPCVFELGGKAPAIVLNDAPVSVAARALLSGGLFNSGQICMSTERIIVQRGVEKELVAAMKELAAKISVGDHPEAAIGPLVTLDSAKRVEGILKAAKAEGAEILVGDCERRGAVIGPHLLKVSTGSDLWKRESFGPVIVMTVVDTVDEAVDMANDSDYSLMSSLWTKDLYLARDVASRIHAGFVNLNGSTFHGEAEIGLVGLGGSSGYGRFDVANFTVERVVVTHSLDRKYPVVD